MRPIVYKLNRGFSLIEILIVVAIVAIIAAIALPSYQGSVQKSRRTDAKSALTEIAAAQEKMYFKNGVYTDSFADVYGGKNESAEGFYNLRLSIDKGSTSCSDDGECFVVVATPKNSQAGDTSCAEFSVNSVGVKAAKDSGSKDTTTTCW